MYPGPLDPELSTAADHPPVGGAGGLDDNEDAIPDSSEEQQGRGGSPDSGSAQSTECERITASIFQCVLTQL